MAVCAYKCFKNQKQFTSNSRAKAEKLGVISSIRSLLSHIRTCNSRFILAVSHDCGFACMDGAKMFLDSKQVNWQGA